MRDHSPGPWRIERRHDGFPFGVSSPAMMQSDTDILCAIPDGNKRRVHTEADAVLIAAAPELLAACIEANKALARLATYGKLETDDWCKVQSQLANVIQKATPR